MKVTTWCDQDYRKTLEYKPSTYAESQAFFGGFIHGELLYGTTFVSGGFHTCYLYLKKKE